MLFPNTAPRRKVSVPVAGWALELVLVVWHQNAICCPASVWPEGIISDGESWDLQVPLLSQAPPSWFSDARRGMAQSTPVTLIMPVTGAACRRFRDGKRTDTIEEWTSPLKVGHQPQKWHIHQKSHCGIPCSVVLVSGTWHHQWSSREAEAIKQRALHSLGRITLWWSLSIHQHIGQCFGVSGYLSDRRNNSKKMFFPSFTLEEKIGAWIICS